MKFYEIQLLPHGAGTGSLVYDSSDPVKIEEALSRGVSRTTAHPVGGKDLVRGSSPLSSVEHNTLPRGATGNTSDEDSCGSPKDSAPASEASPKGDRER